MSSAVKQARGFVGKAFWSLVTVFLCLIPLQMYLGARQLMNPEGFFVEVLVFGIGVWFVGGAQIILGLIMIVVLAKIWE